MADPGNTEDSRDGANVEVKQFYSNAEKYWQDVKPTIDGMLGGFGQISTTDINGSRAFLRPFLKVGGGETATNRAVDCGAGIGRITKRLLLPIFERMDMVELNQKFLDKASAFIGEESKRVDHFICCGLQDFVPEKGHYDVIWAQWVLGHLTDDHLLRFLQRCQEGLAQDGIIVLKENVTASTDKDFDEDDSSYTRPYAQLVNIILKSGLKILKEQKQKGFPKGLYDVYMFALK